MQVTLKQAQAFTQTRFARFNSLTSDWVKVASADYRRVAIIFTGDSAGGALINTSVPSDPEVGISVPLNSSLCIDSSSHIGAPGSAWYAREWDAGTTLLVMETIWLDGEFRSVITTPALNGARRSATLFNSSRPRR